MPANQRETGNTKRRRTGPVGMWDDLVVDGIGMGWRHRMKACRTEAQWWTQCRAGISTLIHKWKLPKATLPEHDAVYSPVHENIYTGKLAYMDKDFITEWQGSGKFVVGCQILAEMAKAQLPVKRGKYGPIVQRTTNNICESVDKGLVLKDVASPIEWRPRYFN